MPVLTLMMGMTTIGLCQVIQGCRERLVWFAPFQPLPHGEPQPRAGAPSVRSLVYLPAVMQRVSISHTGKSRAQIGDLLLSLGVQHRRRELRLQGAGEDQGGALLSLACLAAAFMGWCIAQAPAR